MNSILITGASCAIGRCFSQSFPGSILLSRKRRFGHTQCNLLDRDQIESIMPVNANIIHLAKTGNISEGGFRGMYANAVNLRMTKNLLTVAKEKNCASFTFISSLAAALRQNESKKVILYEKGKREEEKLISKSQLPWSIIRIARFGEATRTEWQLARLRYYLWRDRETRHYHHSTERQLLSEIAEKMNVPSGTITNCFSVRRVGTTSPRIRPLALKETIRRHLQTAAPLIPTSLPIHPVQLVLGPAQPHENGLP